MSVIIELAAWTGGGRHFLHCDLLARTAVVAEWRVLLPALATSGHEPCAGPSPGLGLTQPRPSRGHCSCPSAGVSFGPSCGHGPGEGSSFRPWLVPVPSPGLGPAGLGSGRYLCGPWARPGSSKGRGQTLGNAPWDSLAHPLRETSAKPSSIGFIVPKRATWLQPGETRSGLAHDSAGMILASGSCMFRVKWRLCNGRSPIS